MADPNLVTTCNFKGREYLIKMNVTSNTSMELLITDKYTGEDWQCCYDVAYIENLTHRTGNFKQFNIFTTMLKSGLLKTSECVTLDLLTFDDLEILRSRRGKSFCTNANTVGNLQAANNNRRYLILTYSVEFDRIHYPLPLEYCGPPDPQVLQSNIRRLESEVGRLQEQIANLSSSTNVKELHYKIEELTLENKDLREEIKHLTRLLERKPNYQLNFLQNAIKNLEDSVITERSSHNKLIRRLQEDKDAMQVEMDKMREKIKTLTGGYSSSRKKSQPTLRLSDPGLHFPAVRECKTNIPDKKAPPGFFGDGIPLNLMRSRSKSPRILNPDKWDNTLRHRDKTPEKLKRRQRSHSRDQARSILTHSDNDIFSSRASTRRENTTRPRTRQRSRSGSNCSCHSRNSSASSPRRINQLISRSGVPTMKVRTPQKVASKTSEIDYGNLENRIHAIQKMLSDGLNLG